MLTRVLQLIDSLVVSGSETVAVNTANALSANGYISHLCATRKGGALENRISPSVNKLILHRHARFDLSAILRLVAYVREHEIDILHAHSSSLFIAVLVKMLAGRGKIVWHDHFGRYAVEERNVLLYKSAVHQASAIIAVNQPLREWTVKRLGVPAERVYYIPNFVPEPTPDLGSSAELPGAPNRRIVCTANFRPQKDHNTLIRAFATVLKQIPDAHLLLVGDQTVAPKYTRKLLGSAHDISLRNIHFLGLRSDVREILANSTIGVLSSNSEGLPLALLEYGLIGLPSIVTDVGQCREVLDNGRCGILVPPADDHALASALIRLLRSVDERRILGSTLQERVKASYSTDAYIQRLSSLYRRVLNA